MFLNQTELFYIEFSLVFSLEMTVEYVHSNVQPQEGSFWQPKVQKSPISTSEGPPIFIFDGKTFSNLNSFDDLNDFGRFFS
jgi:hypothetical protein